MTTTHTPTKTTAAYCAMGAAVSLAVGGVLQLSDSQSSQSTVEGVAEHLILVSFSATLILLIPVMLHLARLAGRPAVGVVMALGMGTLAVLGTISNVQGEDPSFFAAVAVPTNLIWFGGSIALAVMLRRRGLVPLALAIGLPLAWIFALPMSALGGGLVAGAYWLTVGWLLRHDELPTGARQPAVA